MREKFQFFKVKCSIGFLRHDCGQIEHQRNISDVNFNLYVPILILMFHIKQKLNLTY
jgi:hypothetical protein